MSLRHRMERALRTDFSGVRIHEGRHVSQLDADAFTQGNTLHFAPGEFRPDTPEGQELLGHELAHVVQQRNGRVRPTRLLKGTQVNDEAGLEREADALGTHALHGGAALGVSGTGMGTGAVGNVVQRGKKRAKKPKSLKGFTDSRGNTLTAHHKYPYNKIRSDLSVASGGDLTTSDNLKQWGQLGPGDDISKQQNKLLWMPHNLFLGPKPEERSDDPGEDLDTHFTASGTVTPKSEVALQLEAHGGHSGVDPHALAKKLAVLKDQDMSGYMSEEWEDDGTGKRRQKGMPKDWLSKSTSEKLQYVQARKAAKKRQQHFAARLLALRKQPRKPHKMRDWKRNRKWQNFKAWRARMKVKSIPRTK